MAMNILNWSSLTSVQQQQALERPVQKTSAALLETVQSILAAVQARGDQAVLDYTEQFDRVSLPALKYSAEEIAAQAEKIDAKTRAAIDTAYETIRLFHAAQQPQDLQVTTRPGVVCEQKFTPLQSVGLYVPGGSATLPSTALMLGVPAQLADCQNRVLVSPPDGNGELSPAVMYAAQRCGITAVFRMGGAQAIAALAFGTETVPRVDKVFGPGNSYVTAAKQLVSQRYDGCAMDIPAGPSELLVIADDTANPAFVAADLLSQAEHGADSQVILVSTSKMLIDAVQQQLEQQLAQLSRADIARQALASSALILVDDMAQALTLTQTYAPEHLSLQFDSANEWVNRFTTAGSIFVGHYTPEAGGDYATGTNHVLPTYGFARNYSSLGLLDFYRRYTVQSATRSGLQELAAAITQLADVEGLDAHKRAVTIRLEENS